MENSWGHAYYILKLLLMLTEQLFWAPQVEAAVPGVCPSCPEEYPAPLRFSQVGRRSFPSWPEPSASTEPPTASLPPPPGPGASVCVAEQEEPAAPSSPPMTFVHSLRHSVPDRTLRLSDQRPSRSPPRLQGSSSSGFLSRPAQSRGAGSDHRARRAGLIAAERDGPRWVSGSRTSPAVCQPAEATDRRQEAARDLSGAAQMERFMRRSQKSRMLNRLLHPQPHCTSRDACVISPG